MRMTVCAPALPEHTPDKPGDLTDLANWWSRGSITIEDATLQRRASRIGRWKRILPIAGVLIILTALMWPILKPDLPVANWQPPADSTAKGKSTMLDLTYRGQNEQGNPFTVTADKAVRNVPLGTDPAKAGVIPMIDLTIPQANLLNADGSKMELKAKNGLYNEQAQGLNLLGSVRVNRSDGMQLDAPQLSVDFKTNRAWTDQPVNAAGNFGTITGEGLRLENGGKTVIFTGQTRAVLNGAAAPATATKP